MDGSEEDPDPGIVETAPFYGLFPRFPDSLNPPPANCREERSERGSVEAAASPT